jgi:hypothetical protein
MTSFLKALHSRYGAVDDTAYDENAFAVAAANPRQRMKKWEMVGLEDTRQKQAQHSKLNVVSLPAAGIEVAESTEGEIARARLVRVVDLDISRNNLSITDVETIVKALPSLQELQLNGLRLSPFQLEALVWSSVQVLTLNATALSWSDVKQLEKLPKLRALHFESNDLTEVAVLDVCMPTLETLNLGNNRLTSWDLDAALKRQFPKLNDLRLHGNDLTQPEASSMVFADLVTFWVSENAQVVGLPALFWITRHCPKLESLRVSYATLFATFSEAQARMLTIAGIPTLQSLNNGAVRPKERIDAELFYLQKALTLPEDSPDRANYARWQELKIKYASVVMTESTGARVSAAVILNLTFRSLGKPFVQKSLPSSITVAKVKSLVAGFWSDLPVDKQRIVFYCAQDIGAAPPQPLDDDLQTLADFGVGDNAVIEVLEL